MRFVSRVLVSLMGAAAVVVAQENSPAAKPPKDARGGLRFVDTSEITIVGVDVSVSDGKTPVLGLGPEDFEVFQDGKRQQITNFSAYHTAPEAVGAATAVRAPLATVVPSPHPTSVPPAVARQPRFLAIYVDNENIMPQNRNRIMGQVIEFVQQHLQPPDRVMVASYQRSLKIQQTFTSDPDEVADALRKMRRFTGARTDLVSSRRQIQDYIVENGDRPETLYRAYDRVEAFAKEQRNNLMFTVGAFKELVAMMSGLPGKKSILYLSDGLPMSPGMELFFEIQDRYRQPMAVSHARDYESSDLFRSLVTTATASGVTLYAIDGRGLDSELGIEAENRTSRSSLGSAMAVSNYQDSLLFMVDQTGGMAILNANDATDGLARIANDLETYYSLGYRLVPSGDDRRHRVEVRVKGKPKLKLNYKESFIEKSLAGRIADRVMSGLTFDLDDNPLGIELSASVAAPADNNRWTLPVSISIPLDRIALIPDRDELVGYVVVYYAARDDEGKQSDLQQVEHQIRMTPKEYESRLKEPTTFTASLLLESGVYNISVGVRDQLTNQAGYAKMRQSVHPEGR